MSSVLRFVHVFAHLWVFGLAGSLASADLTLVEPITTDRPDFVESSSTVGRGVFQLETSVAYERTEDGPFRFETVFTPTLLRFGFAENWEARIEADGAMRVQLEDEGTAASTTEEGLSDVSIGVKWHTHDGEAGTFRPSVGWLLHADLDVGSSEFRGEGIRPSIRVSTEWELSDLLSLGVMPGLIYDTDAAGDRFTAGILAVVLGQGWSEHVGTFLEVAGHQLASERNGGDVITFDAGATYLLNPDWQLDTAFSWGANDDSPDFAVTLGVSGRF